VGRVRKWGGLAGLLQLSALLLEGCNRSAPGTATRPPTEVISCTPIVKPIVEWDEYVARLDATDTVEVRARVSGYLESTRFAEGQIVREGDLLCVIDRRPFVAAVNRAKADLEEAKAKALQAQAAVLEAGANRQVAEVRRDLAKKQLDRFERLKTQNASTDEEVDIRDSEHRQAQANFEATSATLESVKAAAVAAEAMQQTAQAYLEIAELDLSYTEIRAPITGRISRRVVTEGNLIIGGGTQSTLLTTIVSLDPIHCYFDADEQAFLKYARLAKEGKRLSSRDAKNPVFVALVDETDGFPHQGHMDFVDNRMDPETGTMRGRAILPNPDLMLTPGLFARLRLPGSSRYEAVLIPDMAIGSDQSEKFVFVIESDSSIRRQVVEIGPIAQGLRIVRKGLSGQEQIVLRGLQRVRPGDKVAAKEEQVKTVDSGLPDSYEPVPENQWIRRPVRQGLDQPPPPATQPDATEPPAAESPPATSPAAEATPVNPTEASAGVRATEGGAQP
jgi:RND family efflux transporter MFP subunit